MADPLSGQGEAIDGPWDDFKSPGQTDRGPWDDYKSAQAAPDPNAPGVAESFLRGIPSGGTFGFENKIGFDKDKQEAAQKANPWSYFAGQVAGGFVPAVGASLLAPEVAVPAAVARAAPWLRTGYSALRSGLVPGEIASAGQAAVQGAKLGAVYGGLSGAGHADVQDTDTLPQALEKRAQGAGIGAVEGAATGPVLGVAGHGLYRGAQGVGSMLSQAGAETAPGGAGALRTFTKGLERDRITPDDLIGQIRSEFPDATQTTPGGPGAPLARRFWGDIGNKQPITGDQVEETVRRAMAGDNASSISQALKTANGGQGPGQGAVQSLLDELAERHLGPLNLVDRASLVRTGSGDNTQMQLRAAAATPGEHVGVARENLLERQIGAGGRMGDLFARVIGNPDFDAAQASHLADLKDAGQRAYATAFANEKPFDLQPVIDKWTAKFDGKRGIVPEGVMSAVDSIQQRVPVRNLTTGATVTNELRPPQNLEDFINSRQSIKQAIDDSTPGTPLHNNLSAFYKDLTNEVANTNEDWKTANQLWRDGNAGTEALQAGAAMSTKVNSASRENLKYFTDAQTDAAKAQKDLFAANKTLKQFTPNAGTTPAKQAQLQAGVDTAQARLDAANSRQQLFRVGLVRALHDQVIDNTGETYNLTRQMLLPGAKKMFRTVLGNDADQFINGLQAEAAMHRTYSSQFGSQTVGLGEAKDEMNWAPQVDASLLNPMHWPTKLLNLASDYAARTINANRNKGLMQIYTNHDPVDQLRLLNEAKRLHAIRSNWGNVAGTPVIMSSGPVSGTIPARQPSNQPQPVMQPYRP